MNDKKADDNVIIDFTAKPELPDQDSIAIRIGLDPVNSDMAIKGKGYFEVPRSLK